MPDRDRPVTYGSAAIRHSIVVRRQGSMFWAEVDGTELNAYGAPSADLAVLKLARYLFEHHYILNLDHAFSSIEHYRRACREEAAAHAV